MTPNLESAGNYLDMQGMHALRSAAHKQSPEALEKVAKQFESLFIKMMLKSMRDASPKDGLFDNDQVRLYQDLMDHQLSLDLARSNSLGLADIMVRQMTSANETVNPGGPAGPLPLVPEAKPYHLETPLRELNELPARRPAPEPQAVTRTELPAGHSDADVFASPQAFVEALYPVAEQAAKRLGTQAEVLLAQAALETGWGQRIIRHADGASSFNLFGIKADSRWDGQRVSTESLEFEQGLPVQRRSAFRAYNSYADSFNDYVDFLQSSPRYARVLDAAVRPGDFLQELQDAGYATDPAYADKIQRLLNQDILAGNAVSEAVSRYSGAAS